MRVITAFRANLLLCTALLVAAAVLLTGAIAIYVTRFPIEAQVRDDAIRDAVEHLRPVTLRMFSPQQLSQPLTGEDYQTVDLIIRTYVLDTYIARVKFWNQQGVVTYSSLPDEVGESVPDNEEFQVALGGKIVSEMGKLESVADKSLGQAMEVYLPITWVEGGPPAIVAEV